MAIQPIPNQTNDTIPDEFSVIGPDATAAFEPAGSPAHPTEHASSENLIAAPRTPALDEEDEIEDDDLEEDDDLDEDDDLEDDEDEDEDIDDDDLEDDEEEDLEDEDEDDEEDEDEDEDEEDDSPKKRK